MRRYYTRACNFYYGTQSKNFVRKKKTIALNQINEISFDQIEIITRKSKKKISINQIKYLPNDLKKKVNLDLKQIIDNSPSCVKLVNSAGKLCDMNRVGLDIIDSEDLETVFMADVYDLVHPDHRQAFIEFNQFICNGGEGSLIFKIITLKGVTKTMETFAVPHTLENGEIGHLAITNDISERINREKELYQKNLELEEAKRLSIVGEFTAGIAHEINNPLAIISAKAQLLDLAILICR